VPPDSSPFDMPEGRGVKGGENRPRPRGDTPGLPRRF
jgi:hypothetical protein